MLKQQNILPVCRGLREQTEETGKLKKKEKVRKHACENNIATFFTSKKNERKWMVKEMVNVTKFYSEE